MEKDYKGHAITGDTLLILLNPHHEAVPFILPAHRSGVRWEPILDTAMQEINEYGDKHRQFRGGESYNLQARSLAVLRLRQKQSDGMKHII